MAAKSKTRYAILGMLSLEPKSGYNIKKTIEEGMSVFWSESFGQIYKSLKQLQKEGLIAKKHIEQNGRPNKDIYTITREGSEELKGYLKKPAEKLTVRDEVILKLIFGFNVPRENSIKLIEYELNKLEQRQKKFESERKKVLEEITDGSAKIYMALMMKLGMEFLGTRIRWCKEAINMLYKDNSSDKQNNFQKVKG